MNDLMCDLETLGNSKDKVICQVGAAYFNRVTGEVGRTFKFNVDAASHERVGGKIDAQTVYWWLSQKPEAIASILAEPRKDIREVMNDFNLFAQDAKFIWSHSTFDFVTITDTFKQLDIKPLFRYTTARDIRTLVDLGKVSTSDYNSERKLHHDSLDDCLTQIKYCVAALNNVSARVEKEKYIKKLERRILELESK